MAGCFVAQVAQADPPEEFNWEAEGSVLIEGMFIDIFYNDGSYQIGLIYINNDGFQRYHWFRYCPTCEDDEQVEYYYPYGIIRPGDRFRVIRVDRDHFRFENLTARDNGSYPTTGTAPDRSKQ